MDRTKDERGLSRRQATALLAAGTLVASCERASRDNAPGKSNPEDAGPLAEDLVSSSVGALAQAIRDGTVTSEDITRAYLERIAEVNPPLNAVVLTRAEEALADARAADAALAEGRVLGPLHGVPMTIKDSFNTAQMVSTAGTLGHKDYLPAADATIVARLRAAGAILVGKTNTPEITMSFETGNSVYGETRNPYDLARSPGGSSGGAGAAIAAAMIPFDIGTDTGGSIRVPAHFNGIAGLKPTHGRVPRTGHVIDYAGLHQSKTTVGPLARHVRDLLPLLAIIAGPDGRDPFIAPVPLGDAGQVDVSALRLAWHTDNGIYTPSDDVRRVVRRAVRAFEDRGAATTEAVPGPVIRHRDDIWALGLDEHDGHAAYRRLFERLGTSESEIHSFAQWTLDRSQTVESAELTRLIEVLDRFRSDMLAFFQDYDLMVTPVSGFAALPYGEPAELGALNGFSYTHIHNLTGWPAAVVRCGESADGLPIGVQLIARPWAEHVAVAAAAFLEQVFGGWRMPKQLD